MLIISIYLQILCGTIIYVLEYHYQKRLLCQSGNHCKIQPRGICCILLNGIAFTIQFTAFSITKPSLIPSSLSRCSLSPFFEYLLQFIFTCFRLSSCFKSCICYSLSKCLIIHGIKFVLCKDSSIIFILNLGQNALNISVAQNMFF